MKPQVSFRFWFEAKYFFVEDLFKCQELMFPIITHALTLEVAKLQMVTIAVVETKLTWWDTAYRCQFAQYCGEANATI